MVKHIVFWKFKDHADGREKAENITRVREALEDLPGKISQISELEVGVNNNLSSAAWDVALYSSFATQDDLELYQKHADHQAVVELVGKVVMDRAVVDYEY